MPLATLAEMGYLMRQLAPGISVLSFGMTASALRK